MRFSKFYLHKQIDGLHYINFDRQTNNITIRKPNHSIDLLSTIFINKEFRTSINTASTKAQQLKRFLDFLLIWEIDLKDVDKPVVLFGSFAEYLTLIRNADRNADVIEWAMMDRIPLNIHAASLGRVVSIKPDYMGIVKKTDISLIPIQSIYSTVTTAIQFIVFIVRNSNKYAGFPLHLLPISQRSYRGKLSGTLGSTFVTYYDVEAILSYVQIKTEMPVVSSPINDHDVFTKHEIDLFFSSISTSNNPLDKLLFLVLKCFGLRRGEAANLNIVSSSIPSANALIKMGLHKGKEIIKENLRGDLYFDKSLGNWICSVVNRDSKNTDRNTQLKNRSAIRSIKLLFPDEDKILEALYYGLILRANLMKNLNRRHDYLFVSQSNNSLGQRITGDTVLAKYNRLASKLRDTVDFTKYSPHTFRHYFATYLIAVEGYTLFDVSRLLGHANEQTTKNIYLHFIDKNKNNEPKGIVKDMKEIF